MTGCPQERRFSSAFQEKCKDVKRNPMIQKLLILVINAKHCSVCCRVCDWVGVGEWPQYTSTQPSSLALAQLCLHCAQPAWPLELSTILREEMIVRKDHN